MVGSLIFPFFGNQYSGKLIAHPLSMQTNKSGLELSYQPQHVLINAAPGSDYLFPYVPQMTVGIQGLNSSNTKTYRYDDWTVTAEWIHGDKSMLATMGHDLPFVYFQINGGNAFIDFTGNPTIWYNENEFGITLDGKHYGIFANRVNLGYRK